MSSEVYHLQNGPSVPVEAVSLMLSLESRGFTMKAQDGSLRLSGPLETVTEGDKAAIVRWKAHLLGLVEYCGRDVVNFASQK